MARTFQELLQDCLPFVEEWFPWHVLEKQAEEPELLLLDVREPYEFERMHIPASLNVPRGVLETACEWDFEETVPELVQARERPILVICRSGNRSLLAARQLQILGFERVYSLRTGLRGWNDYELALADGQGQAVDIDSADEYFLPRIRAEQTRPVPPAG